MGHRILSFQFDEDGTFAAGVESATFNYTGNTLTSGIATFAIAELPNIAQAIDELVGQTSNDGTTFTQNTTTGGVNIVYNPIPSPKTIKIGAAPVWPVSKAQSFIDALDLP